MRPLISKVAGWWAGLPLAVVLFLFLFMALLLWMFLVTILLHIAVNAFYRAVFHSPFVRPPEWQCTNALPCLFFNLSVFQVKCATHNTPEGGRNYAIRYLLIVP